MLKVLLKAEPLSWARLAANLPTVLIQQLIQALFHSKMVKCLATRLLKSALMAIS